MTLRERAVQEGFDKGIEKGIEKGMEKGMERAIHQLALKMLTIGESVKKIMAISGLSAAEILSLKNRVHNTDTV